MSDQKKQETKSEELTKEQLELNAQERDCMPLKLGQYSLGLIVLTVAFATPSYSSDALQLPMGLAPCQRYRIVFVTSATTNATSTDIHTYNKFVNNVAHAAGSFLAPLNTTWTAIASTATVSAFTNVGGSDPSPIYAMNGTQVASSTAALFNTAKTHLDSPVYLDEYGNVLFLEGGAQETGVWTGTAPDGSSATLPLGVSPGSLSGTDLYVSTGWLQEEFFNWMTFHQLYGISGDLTVPPPKGTRCPALPVRWWVGLAARLSVLAAGPVTPPPGTPVEASIGFVDLNGIQIGEALNVPLIAGQVRSVDLNTSLLVPADGQAFVRPQISTVPGAYLPPLLATTETFESATGFGETLTTLSTGSGGAEFGVQGIAGGQVIRMIASATTKDPCSATLSFNSRDGNPVGRSLNVYLSPRFSESLDLDAGLLGLQSGQRTEVHPVVTLQTPTNTPGAVSACAVSSEVITKSNGQTGTYQWIFVSQ